MPEFCIDLLKTGLNRDFIKLKELMMRIDPYEEFIARICKKYGPSTTILPYPYVGSYMMYGVMKATMDILGLKGGHMRLPLLDINQKDKKELEKMIFERLKLTRVE
jgi:dihydrodipicolinate synthase/N-acetylneuraminate lyase